MSSSEALPAIYAVTAATLCESIAGFFERLEHALTEDGLKLVQVRDKSLSVRDREILARGCVLRCRKHSAKVLINDDEELARKTDAHGVHVSSRNLASMRLHHKWELVGASVHNQAEAELACARLDASLLAVSPVCRTLTHIDAPVLGWDGFSAIASQVQPTPCYALGGLQEQDLELARSHGAYGIAAMRAPWALLDAQAKSAKKNPAYC